MFGHHFPVILIIAPLLSAFLVSLLGIVRPHLCRVVAAIGLGLSCLSAVGVLYRALMTGDFHYWLGGWAPPVGIEFVIDPLNGLVLVVVSFIAFWTLIHSSRFVERDFNEKQGHFYTLFLLLVAALLGMTATGDAFNLYVMVEISALTTYALIAMAGGRAYVATFNYIMMGTIGACLYLLGVGYLYIKTGSLNMADLHAILPAVQESPTITVAFILMLVGVFVKMALFPLGGWLPNAYSHAPPSVSALIAPLMTKVSVYIMLRLMLSIFSANYVFNVLPYKELIVWVAVVAILAGAFFALAQQTLRKMLAYIIIAEVGYMVGGAWLGNELGLTGAIFHILSDALVTSLVFLAVANIIYKTRHQDFGSLKDLFSKMPYTMGLFVFAAISLIGVPPTSSFFSKFYLLSAAYEAEAWAFMFALIFSSLINAVLFFRIIEIAFFSDGEHHQAGNRDEVPFSMLLPTGVIACAVLGLGLFSGGVINNIIRPLVRGML